MTRQEKDQFIDQLAAKLTASENFYLTDISGLTVGQTNLHLRDLNIFMHLHV